MSSDYPEIVLKRVIQQGRSRKSFEEINGKTVQSIGILCKSMYRRSEVIRDGIKFGIFTDIFFLNEPEALFFYRSLDVVELDDGKLYLFLCAIVAGPEEGNKVVILIFVSPYESFFYEDHDKLEALVLTARDCKLSSVILLNSKKIHVLTA
jgi:hypothetical protein